MHSSTVVRLSSALQPALPHNALSSHDVAQALVHPIAAIAPDTSNLEVFTRFKDQDDLMSLPVVSTERPLGLINRHLFMEQFARPFARELYQHKNCSTFMDPEPLVIDVSTPIQTLATTILEAGDKVLADGFIITRDGLYRGMGRAQDVLAAIARMQEEKSRIVEESIEYGRVIQKSISRASRETLAASLPEHFLLWEPRDTVSGDLYHFREFTDGYLLVLFDCTGHGVPGAFMTLIMSAFMQGAINADSARDPGALLADIHRRVKNAMGQHAGTDDHHADDGMDAAVCWIERDTCRLTYAGAQIPLFLLPPSADDFTVMEGDRAGVGYAAVPMEQSWHNHVIDLEPGTLLYLFTDGLFDQPGGAKRIAFGKRRMRRCLLQAREAPLTEQAQTLLGIFREYQGSEPRRDDVCALGLRLWAGGTV